MALSLPASAPAEVAPGLIGGDGPPSGQRGSAPWVGDLPQVTQGLVHLAEPLLADVFCPLGEHPFDLGVGCLGNALGPWRQPHQTGTTVSGVGDALHVTRRLELLDQKCCALLGDAGLQSKVGDPGPARGDPGRHAGLGQRDVGDARSNDGVERSLLERPVGDEEQDAKFPRLT